MALTILDAGVVIAILDASDLHHAAAREAVTRARNRGEELAIPASAYAEVLVGPYRQSASTAAKVALVVATAVELRAGLLLTTDAGWPSLPIPVTVVAGSGKEPGT
jgi:predicted nucleic acid-binding protein